MAKTNTVAHDHDKYALKQRVLNIAKGLPEDYVNLVCEADPELDTPKGRRRVMRVKTLRSADTHITQILETISSKYLQLKKSLKP